MIQALFRAAALVVCSLATTQAAYAAPNITVGPSGNTTVGSTVVLSIDIADAVDLYAWQFDISFGPTGLLAGQAATVGSFLGSGQTFGGGTVNNALGSITTVFSALSGSSGVSGAGTLAQVSFNTLAVGTANVSVSNVQFLDSNLDPILPGSISGATLAVAVVVVPEPVTAVLMGLGLGLLGLSGLLGRSKRRAAAGPVSALPQA